MERGGEGKWVGSEIGIYRTVQDRNTTGELVTLQMGKRQIIVTTNRRENGTIYHTIVMNLKNGITGSGRHCLKKRNEPK